MISETAVLAGFPVGKKLTVYEALIVFGYTRQRYNEMREALEALRRKGKVRFGRKSGRIGRPANAYWKEKERA